MLRKAIRWFGTTAVVVMIAAPPELLACAACYGKSDSALAQGMNWGILSLLALVVFVLGGIAAFFVYLAKRAAGSNGVAAVPVAATESTKEL